MLLGFDIGGTKCAVITARWDGTEIQLVDKVKLKTDLSVSPEEMLDRLIAQAERLLPEKTGGYRDFLRRTAGFQGGCDSRASQSARVESGGSCKENTGTFPCPDPFAERCQRLCGGRVEIWCRQRV